MKLALFLLLLVAPLAHADQDDPVGTPDRGTYVPAPPISPSTDLPASAVTPGVDPAGSNGPNPLAAGKRRDDEPWFRSPGEYLAYRSSRALAPTDVTTKIITDAKRFDVGVGKRIPVFEWSEDGPADGWSAGVDGGMLASLIRYTNQGRLTFATNTFDGMFGIWLGYVNSDGWLVMFRSAHLSAHLVDNSPLILNAVAYSQFWNEAMLGKTFPEVRELSDWNLHLQASVGLNNTSIPSASQPRADVSADFGYAFNGPDSLGVLATADTLRAGVQNQPLTYEFFLGLGYLSRPQTTHRPLRFGLAYFRGSDYRNQLYFNTQNWLTFEVAAEF